MTVLKEAMFQDRAMDEIHKLLPRLYRFTKIPYAQCTSPNKSRCILREELKDESTYNVCFQWGCLQPYRSQHYVGVWSLCWVKENCLLCQGTQHRYMLGNQPAAFFFLFFLQSPVGSITVVYFTSYTLTLLMPLPQVAWQHNYLCKKVKKKWMMV